MIPDFMRDSVAGRFSDWRSSDDRYDCRPGEVVTRREVVDAPVPEPPAPELPDFSRSIRNGAGMNLEIKQPRKPKRNAYPEKRESPRFAERTCDACDKPYKPAGAAQRTCGLRECLLSLRRSQNHERREREATTLTKAEKKALRDACQHPEWYRYGSYRRMCKVCGRTAPAEPETLKEAA